VANWPDLKQRIRPIASYDTEASMLRALSIVEPAELEAPVDDTVTTPELFHEKVASIGRMPED
jgi:hypothetical protein